MVTTEFFKIRSHGSVLDRSYKSYGCHTLENWFEHWKQNLMTDLELDLNMQNCTRSGLKKCRNLHIERDFCNS